MKSDFKKVINFNPVCWPRIAIYGFLLFITYHSSLDYLLRKWHEEDFTYCYMIPLIVLYLIWEKRKILAEKPSLPSWKGSAPLVLGILLFFLGDLASEYTLQFFSLWLVMVGLCWLHLGWKKLKLISFPVVFSLAMFVPPNALYAPLTLKLKLISSQIGVLMMQMYGLSAYREGNVIDLGFTQLQVVDACSGLRYVIPLFVMGILMAYYYKAAFWKKAFLVASTIPLSIITNSLRIASVGILYQFWGPAVAEGFFHDFSGWFIFMASLAFLLLEMWLLKKIFRERGAINQERGTRNEERGDEETGTRSEERGVESTVSNLGPRTSNLEPQEASQGLAGFFRPPQFIAAVIVLLVTVSIAQTVNFREKTPLAKPFSGFPLQVGEWNGARQEMEQQFLDTLKLSDYVMIDYLNPQGKQVSFYVAYNASQSKGEATHSPATCLPYSGWVFNESGTATVPGTGKGDKPVRVCRAFMEKNGEKQLVYFWFPQRGRVLTSIYQIKLYNFWDALTRHRTDGALVRIITPVYQNEGLADAETRLRGFTKDIAKVLGTYLPK
jgi:exosortase D (VPLPA-CTERM-specific)